MRPGYRNIVRLIIGTTQILRLPCYLIGSAGSLPDLNIYRLTKLRKFMRALQLDRARCVPYQTLFRMPIGHHILKEICSNAEKGLLATTPSVHYQSRVETCHGPRSQINRVALPITPIGIFKTLWHVSPSSYLRSPPLIETSVRQYIKHQVNFLCATGKIMRQDLLRPQWAYYFQDRAMAEPGRLYKWWPQAGRDPMQLAVLPR